MGKVDLGLQLSLQNRKLGELHAVIHGDGVRLEPSQCFNRGPVERVGCGATMCCT